MAMYTGIFIGNYAKNMAFMEHSSDRSMGQMDLLRKKDRRFYGILQSSVITRLNLDDKILLLFIKPRSKLRS